MLYLFVITHSLSDYPECQPIWFGLSIVAALFIINFTGSCVLHQYFFLLNRVGMRIKSGTIAMVYNKALRTNHAATQSKSDTKKDDDKQDKQVLF